MKPFAILFTIAVLLASNVNAQVKIEHLPGTWKVVEFETDVTLLSGDLISWAKEEALSSVYTFTKGNTFSMTSKFSPNGESGGWTFTEKNKALLTEYKPGGGQTQEEYNIVYLTKDSMKWTHNIEDVGTLTLILKKD